MKYAHLITTFLLLASCVVAHAQPEVDLALDIVVEPPGVVEPGAAGTMTLTVTNLGPDSPPASPGYLGLQIFSERPFDFVDGPDIDMFDISEDFTCWYTRDLVDLPPGVPLRISFLYIFRVDTFPLGTSYTCELQYFVNPSATESFEVLWESSLSGVTDPNPANNDVTIPFIIAGAPTIPTLSEVGLGVLTLVLLVAGLGIMNRRRTAHAPSIGTTDGYP